MSKGGVKLTAKWQLDAALLSRPVDLTALVSMSRSNPESFLDDNTLHRLISSLLNEKNNNKSDKDTKLDVLNILANVSISSKKANAEVRSALQGVSEWFDDYMTKEESTPGQEPELNKAMVLLLARCWDYRLKTEDVLELTQGNRKIALCTVVGLLEDGETYSTELKQRQKPGQGKMGQWEHELVCHRFEKPLLLQICRLLRGFTHPGTYFESAEGEDLALYSVEKFASEMDTLLEITLRSNLVEKLSMALYDVLFEHEDFDEQVESKSDGFGSLSEYDHIAVTSAHAFLQNLYFYASQNIEEYRRHMLMETLLVPRFVLPYLDRCVIQATILNTRAEAYRDMLEGDLVAEMALHNPNLVKGIAASLRTLIIASFRAPQTQFVMMLLRRLNPTTQLLRAAAFCRYHDYIFTLICMLNINMGALDMGGRASANKFGNGLADVLEDDTYATIILSELANIYMSMDKAKQSRVTKRLMLSGALPISRDTPSYAAMMSIVEGGLAGQFDYIASGKNDAMSETFGRTADLETSEFMNSRAEAKKAHMERMSHLRQNDERDREILIASLAAEHKSEPKQSAFKIAVSVANAGDSKEAKAAYNAILAENKQSENNDPNKKYRLLGDLPALGANKGKDKVIADRDVDIALNLDLNLKNKNHEFMKNADSKESGSNRSSSNKADPTIPKDFLCAINGHVMKDPVRAKTTGLVFESATIDLWLQTRGAVCPITNTPLEKSDLVPDDDLRNQIKRYHIKQVTQQKSSSFASTNGPDDDLYDF